MASVACVAVAVAAGSSQSTTTLYKWVDADGVTHYSDQPAPGSQEIHVLGAQTYKGGATAASPRSQAKASTVRYTSIEVIRPTAGETIFNPADGHVQAAAAIEPALAAGHQLWFVLDGTRLPEPAGSSLAMQLDVTRGEHTVAVLITDEAGREVIGSPPLQFFVRAPAGITPPQGPALKPKKTS